MQEILGTRVLSHSNLLAISLDLLEDGDGERERERGLHFGSLKVDGLAP